MFKNGFKFGFGMAVGYIIGAAFVEVSADRMLKVIRRGKEG